MGFGFFPGVVGVGATGEVGEVTATGAERATTEFTGVVLDGSFPFALGLGFKVGITPLNRRFRSRELVKWMRWKVHTRHDEKSMNGASSAHERNVVTELFSAPTVYVRSIQVFDLEYTLHEGPDISVHSS